MTAVRRVAILVCGLWALILAAAALAASSPYPTLSKAGGALQLGVVHLGQKEDAPVVIGLRQGLKDLGYVEGRDVKLEIRAGRGEYSAALAAAKNLVTADIRIFVSAGTVATQAVSEAAGSLPVGFTQVGEPVAAGFVKSLSRPGGNMTGLAHLLVDTTSKRFELLKELVPSCRSVLLVFDPGNPTSVKSASVARQSAKALGVRLRESHVKNQDDVKKAIAAMDRKTVDAMLVIPDSLVVNAGQQIIEKARHEKLPVMFHEDTWVSRGGLASYGPSFVDLGRRAALYVDKIAKGANPGDLPVEQPTKFELVINRRTAKALGITIPESVMFRADRVVE